MIKIILKKITPTFLIKLRRYSILFYGLTRTYYHDLVLYFMHSGTKETKTCDKLIGKIIADYHGLEKGMTMPSLRLGFGQQRAVTLINDCIYYINNCGVDNNQLLHAIGVVFEYKKLHDANQYVLEDELNRLIVKLEEVAPAVVSSTQQILISKEDYWKQSNSSFNFFSESRFSVRNFSSTELSVQRILVSLELAKNTPSACNRQSWRTYIITDMQQIEEILIVQGGNNGFGQLINKLILVTGEVGVFRGRAERNQVFIDGGIYAMNLLYSLHFNKIGACILNCSNSLEKEALLRELTPIKESEVFIAFVGCGNLPEKFNLAISKRSPISSTNTIVLKTNINSRT